MGRIPVWGQPEQEFAKPHLQNNQSKTDWRYGSSSRTSALRVQALSSSPRHTEKTFYRGDGEVEAIPEGGHCESKSLVVGGPTWAENGVVNRSGKEVGTRTCKASSPLPRNLRTTASTVLCSSFQYSLFPPLIPVGPFLVIMASWLLEPFGDLSLLLLPILAVVWMWFPHPRVYVLQT
jgi:hypothetical protein